MGNKKINEKQSVQEPIESLKQQSKASIKDRSGVGYLESLNILELIHELKAHRAGLDLQNDEIRHLQQEMSGLQQEVKQLYDNAPCGYLKMDKNGNITNANLMALDLLKIKYQDLVQSGFKRFVAPKYKRSYQKSLQKAAESGEQQRVELQLRNSVNKTISILLEIDAEFDDAAEFLHYRLVILNITLQKLAENKYQESEKRYQAVFDNSPIGLNVFSMEGQILDANKASCKMHGYTKDEILGLMPKNLVKQDFIDECKGFLQTPADENHFHAFTKNIKKDGTEFPVEVIGVKFPIQGELGFLGITHDITERIVAKEELEKSHEKFQSLFRQLPVAVLIVDMDGTILDFNSETMLNGIPREALLGKKFSSLNISCKRKLSKIFSDVSDGDVNPFECEVRRTSGKICVIEMHPEVITYDDTKKLLFTLLDITKRKKSEQIIEKKTQQLHSLTQHLQSVREEEKAYIAREIHDELGQVLSALNMNLSGLEQEINNETIAVNRQKILAELRDSKDIVRKAIIDVRKMITELRPPELDILGLIPALKRQINDFEKNSKIAVDFISEADDIELDETYNIALFRIVQEALTNVAKHAKATRVKIVLGKNGNIINLSIVDNGIGFDSKVSNRKKSFGLLGMEERVMLLDGNINIKSESGRGTEISINMPMPG